MADICRSLCLTSLFKQAAPPPSAKRALVSQGLDVNVLYKLTFEQAETLFFSELGWGDAEAEALSKELYAATSLKKLFLNGNAIQCAGASALAASLSAPSLPSGGRNSLAPSDKGGGEEKPVALKPIRRISSIRIGGTT